MEGTYTLYGNTIVDPEIDYYFVGRNIITSKSNVEILVKDTQNLENSVPLNYEVDDEPTDWTLPDIAVWVEAYLQQYRV